MNGPQFFETGMGRKFYDGTMPRIAEALMDIAAGLKAATLKPEPPARPPLHITRIECVNCQRVLTDVLINALPFECPICAFGLVTEKTANVDVNREAALADLRALAEMLLATDPGKREGETDADWHDRFAEWAMDATTLATDVRDLLAKA